MIPTDLSSYADASMAELRPLLEGWASEPDAAAERRLRSLVIHRCLHQVRSAPRSDLNQEAGVLHGVLEGEHGDTLKERLPEAYGGLFYLAKLLSEAARRSDPDAIDSVVRSHPTYGLPLLENLAASSQPVPRQELRERLSISESQLSHLLHDFEEANLVVRLKTPGTRGVSVKITREGQDYVDKNVPGLFERLVEELEALIDRGPSGPLMEQVWINTRLRSAGLPEGFAGRLAELLASLFENAPTDTAAPATDINFEQHRYLGAASELRRKHGA